MSEMIGSPGTMGSASSNGHGAPVSLPQGLAGAVAGVGGGVLWLMARRRRRSRREKAEERAREMAAAAGGATRKALRAAKDMAGRAPSPSGLMETVSGWSKATEDARTALAKRAEEVPPKVADGLNAVADRMRSGTWEGWAVILLGLWAAMRWSDRRQLRRLGVAARAAGRQASTRPSAPTWAPA